MTTEGLRRSRERRILLTGATGYVGGRLLLELERLGRPIRCLAREPAYLEPKAGEHTEIVQGDVLAPETLVRALQGIDVAFYLVHSMGSSGDFEAQDRKAAESFAAAAREAGVRRIVYLGGLGHAALSSHLASRQEVGRILRTSGVETVELRASIVIGSGSLSFELIRGLVERLPVMVTPRWVGSLSQPIAIDDVIAYLVEAADIDIKGSTIFEIGGRDRATYGQLMEEYARQRGLNRVFVSVPVLTPRLSSLWLGLVTPVYARVGRKLVESLQNETTVRDQLALETFDFQPIGLREALARALTNEDSDFALTRWSDAVSSGGIEPRWGGSRLGTRVVDTRSATVQTDQVTAFEPIRRIGGQTGWYYGDWLWQLRGFLDMLTGGVGLRRGRRDPRMLTVGETLDFWRVESFDPPRRLRLRAEMRVPGRAWLDFEVSEAPDGSVIHQTAIFDPAGVTGRMYWYGLYPLHELVFGGMLSGIVRAAEAMNSDKATLPIRPAQLAPPDRS